MAQSTVAPSQILPLGEPAKWVVAMARLGFAAKGAVYLVVGGLALRAAFLGGRSEGPQGAIQEIGRQPFGQVLLWVIAAGLASYFAWRVVEAISDPDHLGKDAKGAAVRVGRLANGIVYAGLALTALGLAVGQAGGRDGQSQKALSAQALSLPLGQWLVGLAGAAVIGIGVAQMVRAWKASFMKHYDHRHMPAEHRRWAMRLGRFGLASRGVTFGIIGVFLIVTAIRANPNEARGLGESLDELAAQPFGPWLLAVVALGLAAYGVYCFSYAAYRAFRVR